MLPRCTGKRSARPLTPRKATSRQSPLEETPAIPGSGDSWILATIDDTYRSKRRTATSVPPCTHLQKLRTLAKSPTAVVVRLPGPVTAGPLMSQIHGVPPMPHPLTELGKASPGIAPASSGIAPSTRARTAPASLTIPKPLTTGT